MTTVLLVLGSMARVCCEYRIQHDEKTFPGQLPSVCFVLSILVSPSFFSPPPVGSRNSDPGSLAVVGSPASSPTLVPCLNLYHESTSARSLLVDWRRTAPTHATRSQKTIPIVLFL